MRLLLLLLLLLLLTVKTNPVAHGCPGDGPARWRPPGDERGRAALRQAPWTRGPGPGGDGLGAAAAALVSSGDRLELRDLLLDGAIGRPLHFRMKVVLGDRSQAWHVSISA